MKLLLLLALSSAAFAQAPATRITPCDPATPYNAICLVWTAPTTYSDGTQISSGVAISYRVEQRTTGSAWTTIQSGITGLNKYIQNLAPAAYLFRVYATANALESVASNETTRGVAAPPNAPVLTIAVVIGQPGVTPVYRVLGSAGKYYLGEMYGLIPVGRECTGPKVASYRGKSFRRVFVQANELWWTTNNANLAAACG